MTRIQRFDGVNHQLKRCAFTPQALCFIGVIPDTGLG
jgi:hypothetical protein